MKLNKIALALSTVFAGFALSNALVCQAETHEMNATTTKENSVLTMDPQLNFFYKAQYRNEKNKTEEANKDKKSYDAKEKNDFSHGAGFTFDSGYVNNYIGAIIGASFVNPVYVKKGLYAVHAPTKTNDAGVLDGGETLTKFQQVYLKARYEYNDIELNAGYGVKQRNFQTFRDCTSRIFSANSFGYDFSATGEGLTAYFTSILGGSSNKTSDFVKRLHENVIPADSKKDYDSGLYLGGFSYDYEDLTVAVEYGIAKAKAHKDISPALDLSNKRWFAKVGYKLELAEDATLELDARYGHNKISDKDGVLTSILSASGATFPIAFNDNEYKSSFYNLNATVHYDSAFITLGYNKVKDGHYFDRYFLNSIVLENSGRFNSTLSLKEDFCLEGEQAFLVKIGYDLTAVGVDGLRAAAWFAKGSDAKINGVELKGFSRKELGLELCYDFQDELKGLSLGYKYVNYRASVDDGQLTSANKDLLNCHIKNCDEHRVTLSYAYDLWK